MSFSLWDCWTVRLEVLFRPGQGRGRRKAPGMRVYCFFGWSWREFRSGPAGDWFCRRAAFRVSAKAGSGNCFCYCSALGSGRPPLVGMATARWGTRRDSAARVIIGRGQGAVVVLGSAGLGLSFPMVDEGRQLLVGQVGQQRPVHAFAGLQA